MDVAIICATFGISALCFLLYLDTCWFMNKYLLSFYRTVRSEKNFMLHFWISSSSALHLESSGSESTLLSFEVAVLAVAQYF